MQTCSIFFFFSFSEKEKKSFITLTRGVVAAKTFFLCHLHSGKNKLECLAREEFSA